MTSTDNVACCLKAQITMSIGNKMIQSIHGDENTAKQRKKPQTEIDQTVYFSFLCSS